jgi:hypothetical protein
MTPQTAAESLRANIAAAPRAAVTVWAWHEDNGAVRLIVRVNPRHPIDLTRIPRTFAGYPVSVERREAAIALRR